MPKEIQRLPDVLSKFGVSRSHIYQQVKEGLFIKPIRLGKRAVGWPSDEISTLLSARIAGQSNDQIKSLVSNLEASRESYGNL
jgi:prophage regulatory protein